MPASRSTASKRPGSIANRLMLGTALIAMLCFGVTAAISYREASQALVESSRRTMQSQAEAEARRVNTDLSAAFATSQALADSLVVQHAAGTLSRGTAAQILQQQLRSHPEWVGLGTLWEPQAFDGKDADFVDAEAHDATGRFMSYWAWQDGNPVQDVLKGYDVPGDGDWYLRPRELKRPTVAEPYRYEIGGKPVLMTTLSTPVLDNGTFLGAVTVDFGLAALQERLAALRPMGEGHVELISPAGIVLAAADAKEIGTRREDAATRRLLAQIAADKPYEDFHQDAAGNVKAYVPLRIGGSQERFALGVIVPHDLITAQARALLWIILAVGLGAALVLSGSVYVLLRRQAIRPLADAVRLSAEVADGRLDTPLPAVRDDEVGRLLQSMQRMRDQLQAVMTAQAEMARRHEAGELSYRMDAEGFPGAYGRMVHDTNHLVGANIGVTRRLVEVMQRYAVGDLTPDMDRLPGEQAAFTAAMDTTKGNLRAINTQIQDLAGAAAIGDFSQRGDVVRFDHDFRLMVENLNTMMQVSDDNLQQISDLLQAIAAGDLTARMHGEFHGVFARMRDDADTTVSQLTDIVGRIQQATDSINLAAGEIASGNSDLSRRTEQQAASLEETAASMEELTSTVRQNADHAVQANQLAAGAAEVASQGGLVVGQVVTTMAGIEASSKRIAEIITVIDGIAFQTNILALNAAVEAARAGEQGRGFAVVASEVRALAQRSAGAAKEIKTLIDDSVEQVSQGSALVQTAGRTMEDIVSGVRRVNDIMAEISAASKEQSAGIEQVNQTITQMDETTQQNAALVEEATAAARAMEEQAQQLGTAVSIFRLQAPAAPVQRAGGRAPATV
ncbi:MULTISPECIES: methyl-accepting chemotaxis protein [Stenotrophomonas]|jgi:methyl-accepting chemotaxis protein|uniref:Methyl-accepting chemotaxis protein n=1 Tax=Stenotrophomonas maltophilia TaxID=40324 RepID=A0A4V3RIZ5_STEMA|nr:MULTISPECIES: methyl-accepting chemotaxis protein [Stenotrophomonas]QIO89635.1 chemotaxis protein [Stenotrophomonas rhizophila]TGY33950.1 methyl-accepting chemotaxis protein [Stenotrophomonas maltophilia]